MHRVAIGNSRLVSVTYETVTFRYKDYRHGGGEKEMTLPGAEFARRFMQQVLPRAARGCVVVVEGEASS